MQHDALKVPSNHKYRSAAGSRNHTCYVFIIIMIRLVCDDRWLKALLFLSRPCDSHLCRALWVPCCPPRSHLSRFISEQNTWILRFPSNPSRLDINHTLAQLESEPLSNHVLQKSSYTAEAWGPNKLSKKLMKGVHQLVVRVWVLCLQSLKQMQRSMAFSVCFTESKTRHRFANS